MIIRKDFPGPILCMNQEKKAFDFMKNYISYAESCAILTMSGMGKEVITEEIIQYFTTNKLYYTVKILNAVSASELQLFLDSIYAISYPLLCIINIAIEEDISWFIEELYKLRIKRGYEFVTAIISNLPPVYTAVTKFNKILTHKAYILQPITFEDAEILLDTFEKRFGFFPTIQQKEKIYRLSSGYVGLFKSLYFLLKETPHLDLSIAYLLQQETIVFRLRELLAGFPDEVLDFLKNSQKPFHHASLVEKFGFIKNNLLINPLLSNYLQSTTLTQINVNLQIIFSGTELSVFNFLVNHPREIVERTVIAQVLWDSQWEEKYSDWAIDQLMHRLREKVIGNNLPYQIETKKGKGFFLLPMQKEL